MIGKNFHYKFLGFFIHFFHSKKKKKSQFFFNFFAIFYSKSQIMFLEVNFQFLIFVCFSIKTVVFANKSIASLNSIVSNSNKPLVTTVPMNLKFLIKKFKREETKNKIIPQIFKKFQFIDFSFGEHTHQFCGETLFYAVEYYCVYVKGTSVYSSENDSDESTNVIRDSLDNNAIKKKRETGIK
jgi:hypothetical protein